MTPFLVNFCNNSAKINIFSILTMRFSINFHTSHRQVIVTAIIWLTDSVRFAKVMMRRAG